MAAQEGLSLAAAVRANGLAGGGPERPVGARRALIRWLAHTVGADGVFVRLAAAARRRAAAGADDALLEWRNAAACAWRHVRPDGYGLYRHAGRLYGLFLEYDRGTMTARDHRRKFAAYHHYLAGGRFEREYRGFPTVLVVTAGPGPEARIAAAVRSAGVGWAAPLPVLLTTTGRLEAARDGLLGPIWRAPDPGPIWRWPATAGSVGAVSLPTAAAPRVRFEAAAAAPRGSLALGLRVQLPPAPAGNRVLTARADPGEQLAEANEANNGSQGTLRVIN